MKHINKIRTLAVAAMLAVIALSNFAFGQSCCLTFPANNNTLTAAVTVYPGYDQGSPPKTTPPAWFAVDVTDANAPIPTRIYPAWCVDETYFLPAVQITIPGTTYSGTLISTCDQTGLGSLPYHGGTPPVGPPPPANPSGPTMDTWHKINYLLNHKTYPDGTPYYWWNVQVAINRLVGGPAPNDPALVNPSPGYPPPEVIEINTILDDVNKNAGSWTSQCGDKVGVIFAIPDLLAGVSGTDDPNYTGAVQLIMLEVPCTCPSANCVTINAVQYVPITPVKMTASGGCAGSYTFSATGLPKGLTMSTDGTISGTPTVSGTFSYTVTVTDACGNTSTINCSVTVNPPPSADCVTIPAVQGVNITGISLTGSGGCGVPYKFAQTGLPLNLTMTPGGTISGTPTVSGTFPYTVTITDSCGNQGTINCSVTVLKPPTANCVTITAVQGTAITPVTMVGSGGCGGPYTFSATGLPAGLTMSASGTISGTPTVSGTFNYTVTITDHCSNTGTVNCTVTVNPPPCISGTLTFAGNDALYGTAGNSKTFTANGVSVKVTAFSRVKSSGSWATAYLGAYPGGLGVTDNSEGTGLNNSHCVDNNGLQVNYVLFEFSQPVVLNRACLGYVVQGSDLKAWIGTFTDPFNNHLTLSDSVLRSFGYTEDNLTTSTTTRCATLNAGQVVGNAVVIAALPTAANDYFKINTLDICVPVQPLALACAGGTGQVGTPYSSALVASGGVSPYTFAIIGGTLPPGLTLNPTTGALTGTPTALGTFAYTAMVTDSSGGTRLTATVSCNIEITLPPCVPSTFDFNGNSAASGTLGNIRTFTTNGISVKASAFSRSTSGVWATAYLGSYPGGLGVTDNSEGTGANNTHTLDNIGQNNYILFEFSQPVTINRAYLGYVVTDSDLNLFVGSFPDPFNNHLTLSDANLSLFGYSEENLTTSTTTRWADLNAGAVTGNAIVISAHLGETSPNDMFKIALMAICQPPVPVTVSCAAGTAQVNVSYSSAVVASGGCGGGYTFKATGLPTGLTMATDGTISGTPTTSGTFAYTATATDKCGSQATVNCSITVMPYTSYRAAACAGASSGCKSLTINLPTGTQAGDLMLASIAVRPNTTIITAPSGWTLLRRTDNANPNANSLATYYKLASAGDTASFKWLFNSSTGAAGGIQSFSGVDTANPIDVHAGQNTANALTHTAPSVTTRYGNDIVVTVHALPSSAKWTSPSGMTEDFDVSSDPVPNSVGISIQGNYRLQPAAGATGTMVATASNDADVGNAQTIALKSSTVALKNKK